MRGHEGLTRLRPEAYKAPWRTQVALRHNELLERLMCAGARRNEHDEFHLIAARAALDDAGRAVESNRHWGRGTFAWWTGSAVNAAWEALHYAERELMAVEDEGEVLDVLPRLLSWMQQVVPAGKQRSAYERKLGEYIEGGLFDRDVVRQAHQVTQTANSEWHANLRAFRNLLLIASGALAAALVALAMWHAINPDFVSLCGSGGVAGGGRGCLTGSSATGRDVLEVEVVGCIGGLLSVAFGLGAVKTPPSRYNLRAAQAVLKPVVGAATGFVGVLLVQSHILVAPTTRPSESLLLAYAAIFGFSQQLLTQFVDRRAGKLLGGEGEAG
jgi:hypothetical protein